MVKWLLAVRTFQLSFVARQSVHTDGHYVDGAVGVGLSGDGGGGDGGTVYSRGRKLGLPMMRRPPQSVDAGGSGRQTVSPTAAAAAHHTTTSLSLPSGLLSGAQLLNPTKPGPDTLTSSR